MTRMPTWLGVLTVCALAFALSACKSRTGACNTCAAPACSPPVYTSQPPIADGDSYVVPSPDVPYDSAVTQADLDAANAHADAAARERADYERQWQIEQDNLARRNAELEDARRRIADLESAPTGTFEEAPRLVDADADRLANDLRSSTGADVVREGDLVVMRVVEGFKAGSDQLRGDAAFTTALNAAVQALKSHPGATVSVVGHSDGDPIKKSRNLWESNDQLSLARAQRVAGVLAESGVDQNRITIDGRGFREPIVPNEQSAADKARNRRVEIMIRL
ncbi:MAG: OmpA family protein [Planctomycetota bacterium]|nr:OmpA family protein [Planctomycetota bacterium]